MENDLKRAKNKFEEFLAKIKTKKKITEHEKSIMYCAFLVGFVEGSGMTGVVVNV